MAYQYRYICNECLMGWHEVPFCPFPSVPQQPRRPREWTPGELRSWAHIHQLERDGILPRRKFSWRPYWIAAALFLAYLVVLAFAVL